MSLGLTFLPPCKQLRSDSIYLQMIDGLSSVAVDATPILDSGVRPKPVRRKTIGSTLLGAALGLVFVFALIYTSNSTRHVRNSAADFTLAFYLLGLFLTVTLHEIGHLLAGWFVGFQFSLLSVGPISLRRQYGKLKVQLGRAIPAAGYAGMHVGQVRRLRRRLLIFSSGGIVANLLTAAGMALFIENSVSGAQRSWLYAPANLFMWISGVIGLVNLVPFKLGMLYTDGARIAMLLLSRARSRRWMCIAAVGNQNQKGVRSKEYKRTWLQAATSLHDGSVDDFIGNWLAYASANDRKDAFSAGLHLERCLELVNLLGPSIQDLVALEAAVFTAWFWNNSVVAESWLRQVKKLKALPQLQPIRAAVALSCALLKYDQALASWQQGLSFIDALPINPPQKQLKEGWLEWQCEIRERQQALAIERVNQMPLSEAPAAFI